jgi:murein DD-endopeptidase MepM/ murein hydrolase activator NlpD
MERSRHLEGLLILVILVVLGGLYLWQNSQPAITVSVPAATPTPADAPPPEWQATLDAQLALAATPLPTPELDVTAFVPPTLPATADPAVVIVEPVQIASTPWPTPTMPPTVAAPTASGPTPYPSPTGIFVAVDNEDIGFEPPPEEVPLSPHANDHFWLVRPVDASANSASLFYYPFGSDGPRNDWRVHHGVDIPNPVGEGIRAGGSGTVFWAGDGAQVIEGSNIEIYPSYGNVVVIEHDFGYRGQKIWTLYAHMSSVLVEAGDYVEAGQIIGLIGGTGDVSGPHVHMEVRMGSNSYFAVYNPLLWIAPYVGHGVVAGRVTRPDGTLAEDGVVTLSQYGRVVETTTTYISPKKPTSARGTWHVVSDPAWNENFVLGDVPEGTYQITAIVQGQRLTDEITVKAGTTNFITLGAEPAATPQPVDDEDEAA